MRVEVTEKQLKDGGYDLVSGDTLTVPDELGRKWCRLGWATDVDGVVPSGERKVVDATVEADPAAHASHAQEG